MSSWDKKEAKILFQELLFYNVLIEKPNIKSLKNIDLLKELSFYDESNIMQISKAFGWYARSYKVEIADSKDPLAQLEAIKSSIKDLLKDRLHEIQGFNNQITVKTLLRKDKQNGDIEFASVYFNSTTQTVIYFKCDLDKSFAEMFVQN